MLKKHIHKILFCLATLGITSLQAAHLLQQEGKNDVQETALIPKPVIGYYNHTLKHSKKKIDNTVDPEELEDEKQDLKETHIAEKLKNSKGAIFFMVIVSNKQTAALSKFFFFNRDPNTAQGVVWKVQKSHQCHVISHSKPRLGPHIVFQLLGWLEQEKSQYTPIFIYASSPICVTCNALVESFFNLHILSNAKGCNGFNSFDLDNICPLAQQYIKRELTFPLAKKLLLPTLRVTYEHKLKLLENKNNQLKQSLAQANEQATKLLLAKEDLQNKHKSSRNLILKKNKEIKRLKDFLRKGIVEVPCSPLKGYKDNVRSVAITSNNKYIVSGSWDKTIRIWDFKTGGELSYSPLTGHKDMVVSVAISSDNRYIVSGSFDNTIRIWDLKTGAALSYSPLKGHTRVVRSVAVTSDNKYIVSGNNDASICIWDLKTGKELPYSPLKGHTAVVSSVAVTTDNKYIVSGSSDKTIRIWDLKTGKELPYSPLKGHASGVMSVAVTTDNNYIVSASDDKTIRIWDFKTKKELGYSPLKGHTRSVNSVAVTKNNKYIVSGSAGDTIRIWDLRTGKELPYSPLKGHTSSVLSVAVTSDNKYIVSGDGYPDYTIRIWDCELLSYIYEDEQKENDETDNEVFDID